MRIDQLETFVEVAKSLSFSIPRETLFVTQSTISKRVKYLENELGVELVRRTTGSVSLTVEGEAFLPYAEEITQRAHAGIEAIRKAAEGRRARLKIGYQHINTDLQTPTLLGRFVEMHGECVADVSLQPDPDVLMADVLSGDLDGAFFSLIDPADIAEGLLCFHIQELREFLILNKEHRLAQGSSICPEDLRGETILYQNLQIPAKTSPLTRELQERGIGVDLAFNSNDVIVERLVQINAGIAPTSFSPEILAGVEADDSAESMALIPLETDYRMQYFFCWRKLDCGLAKEFATYLQSEIKGK